MLDGKATIDWFSSSFGCSIWMMHDGKATRDGDLGRFGCLGLLVRCGGDGFYIRKAKAWLNW